MWTGPEHWGRRTSAQSDSDASSTEPQISSMPRVWRVVLGIR